MKLAIDLACMGTARTGAAVFVNEVLDALKMQLPEEDLVLFKPALYPLKKGGVLAKIWNNFRLYFWIQIQLPTLIKKHHCDALLSPEYLAPLKLSCPRLVVVFDAVFVSRPQEYNFLWRKLFQLVYLPAIKKAEAIITGSKDAKKQIVTGFELDEKKVEVIYDGCNQKIFHPYPEDILQKVMTKYDLIKGNYLIHVGVMEKRKNLPALIRVFAKIKEKHRQLKLVLVGQPGPKADLNDHPNVLAEIEKLDLGNNVVLPGFIPFEDVPLLYQGAKAKVFPTMYEGFGLPVLEAFACGTLVACSRLDVLQEVAGEGANFFDPYSEAEMETAILDLIENQEHSDQLKENSKEQMKLFSWDNTAKEILHLTERLVKTEGDT